MVDNQNLPPVAASLLLGGVLSFGNLANVGSFVLAITYINEGEGVLSEYIRFDNNYRYLMLSMAFLLLSSFVYSFQKNIAHRLKTLIADSNSSVFEFSSFSCLSIKKIASFYKGLSHQGSKIYYLLFLPPCFVILFSSSVICFFDFYVSVVVLLSVVVSSLVFLSMSPFLNYNKEDEIVGRGAMLLISVLAAFVLVAPVVYIANKMPQGDKGIDPSYVVMVFLFLRYVYSSYRNVLFSAYRIFHIEKNFGNKKDHSRCHVFLPEGFDNVQLLHKLNLISPSKIAKKCSSNKLPWKEVTIADKSYPFLCASDELYIKDEMLKGVPKAKIKRALQEIDMNVIILFTNIQNTKSIFGFTNIHEQDKDAKILPSLS